MQRFRKIIFWLHLITGALAGIVILVMSITGALLSFEKNIIEYFEREMRYVAVQPDTPALPVSEILIRVQQAKPDAKISAVSLANEPGAAWQIALGREGQLLVDPYTGTVTGEGAKNVRAFFGSVENWHRWLALSGEQRPLGKALTGACNLGFLFLAISGVYIWFPRRLGWSHFKPVIWFRSGLRGRARNFNWHNVIGFWTSLVLIILTVTAAVISYQWAGNLLYTLTGNEPPAPQQSAPQPQNQSPTAAAIPENINDLWQRAAHQTENPKSISLRVPVAKDAVFTIDEGIYFNKFGRSTLTLNAQTGETAKWEPYGEQNSARRLRSWFRFTHTGESFGIIGQLIGFIACLGGAVLVWTGLALALRRFQHWRSKKSPRVSENQSL